MGKLFSNNNFQYWQYITWGVHINSQSEFIMIIILISLSEIKIIPGVAPPVMGGKGGTKFSPLVVVVLSKIIQIIIKFIILAFFNIVIAISRFYLKFVRFFPKFFWQVQKNWA